MVFDASKYVIEVEKKESEYGRVKPGNYAGKVVHIIDLGSKTKEWEDKDTKEKYSYETKQIFINFALSAKVLIWEDAKESEEKKEQTIWKVYTLSLSKNAKLHIDVKSWFGFTPEDKFNPFTLIWKDVMVNVWEHNGYWVIESLSQMPEGMPAYELDELELDWSILEEGLHNPKLEEKVLFGFAKTDLESSKEYVALTGKEPKEKQQSIEDQEKEIEAEITKSKEAQKETKEVSTDEAEEIFEKKEKDMK